MILLAYQNCSPNFEAENFKSLSSSDTTSTDADSDGTDDDEFTSEELYTDPELVTVDKFKYEGSFRLNDNQFGDSNMNFAVGTLAFNPDNKSLFIVGHAHHNAIAEFPVPENLKKTSVEELEEVSPLQNFRTVLDSAPTGNTNGNDKITGMFYHQGQLIVNSEKWYDASGGNTNTTLVIKDAKNLASSAVEGYYRIQGAAKAAGYISEVPANYQNILNAKHFMGWSSVYSIISRYSIGPSMYTFDINDLTRGDNLDVSTQALMSFHGGNMIAPEANAMNTNGSAHPLWNSLTKGIYGFIVPNTRTFAVVGSSAAIKGGIGYKITQDNGNLCGGPCPYLSDEVYNYIWLFDMDEILNAENIYEPRPYYYGKWPQPYDDNGQNRIIGASYDTQEGALYLAISGAGQTGSYDKDPVINKFSVNKD